MKNPPPIEIDEAEVERLIDQAQQGMLDAADQKQIIPLLRSLVWLQRTLFETRISLSKLKKILFGKRTEKSGRKSQDPPNGFGEKPPSAGGLADPPASSTDTPADTPPDTRASKESSANGGSDATPTRGHGRLGAADYSGAEQIFCAHGEFHAGDHCLECKRGRLYPSRPLVRLRFDGQPLAKVTHYELEQLKHLGAQQSLVYQDDTGARILSLIQENRADPPPERKGMYTTALQFEGEHTICLYLTGRCHAGENLDAILALRDPDLRWLDAQTQSVRAF